MDRLFFEPFLLFLLPFLFLSQGSKEGPDGALPRISSGSITPEGWPKLPAQSEEELAMSPATVDPGGWVGATVGLCSLYPLSSLTRTHAHTHARALSLVEV